MAHKVCQACRYRKEKGKIVGNNPTCTCVKFRTRRLKVSRTRPEAFGSVTNHANGQSILDEALELPDVTWLDLQKSFEPESPANRDEDRYAFDLVQDSIPHWEADKYDRTPPPWSTSTKCSKSQSVSVPLPAYIKQPPDGILRDDIEYLWSKGALSVPIAPLRDELIESYVEHVHPSLPLIFLDEFTKVISTDGKEGNISLLLFQAILFAGISFVDLASLQAAGYDTRREARKLYFEKVKLLYECDFERDNLTIIQSLLLMTGQNEALVEGKDEWHWLSIAISLAHKTGLHMNPDKYNIEPRKKALLKRVWWSIVVRDRLLALGMGKPTRINDRDSDMPMLTLNDFDIPFSDNTLIGSPKIHQDNNILLRHQQAMLFIEKARLCVCIGRILATQYVAIVRDQGLELGYGGGTRSRVTLSPKPLIQSDDVRGCEIELIDWYSKLPASCRYNLPEAKDLDRYGPSLLVERAVLYLIYLSTTYTLYRPQVVSSTIPYNMKATSQNKIRHAIKGTTKTVLDLYNLRLSGYLPASVVTALLSAMTGHLADIKHSDHRIREEALESFFQCMCVLKELRGNYGPADDVFHFLMSVIAQTNIIMIPETEIEAESFSAARTVASIGSSSCGSSHENLVDNAQAGTQTLHTDATSNYRNAFLSALSEDIVADSNTDATSGTAMLHTVECNGALEDLISCGGIQPTTVELKERDDDLEFLLSWSGYEGYKR